MNTQLFILGNILVSPLILMFFFIIGIRSNKDFKNLKEKDKKRYIEGSALNSLTLTVGTYGVLLIIYAFIF